MKKALIIAGFLALSLYACKREDNVSKVVMISYPTITLNGNAVISVGVGTGSYTDPGAVGYDDVSHRTVNLKPVSNNVDLTTPGFYAVQYSMTNANGFVTRVSRLILVTPVSPLIDWSGTYKRVSNGQHVSITKQGTGLYLTNNIGGVAANPSFIFPIYIGQISDSVIQVPPQNDPVGGGTLFCTNGTFSLTPADTTFSYVIIGPSFGTSVRVFTHHP